MGNPNQKHKNQVRICLYFTGSIYLLPKYLLNQFCSHPILTLFQFFFLFHVGLFQFSHLLASLVSPHSTTSSSVTKMFPSKNTRTITLKIIQWLSIALEINLQPTMSLFIHLTGIPKYGVKRWRHQDSENVILALTEGH